MTAQCKPALTASKRSQSWGQQRLARMMGKLACCRSHFASCAVQCRGHVAYRCQRSWHVELQTTCRAAFKWLYWKHMSCVSFCARHCRVHAFLLATCCTCAASSAGSACQKQQESLLCTAGTQAQIRESRARYVQGTTPHSTWLRCSKCGIMCATMRTLVGPTCWSTTWTASLTMVRKGSSGRACKPRTPGAGAVPRRPVQTCTCLYRPAQTCTDL
jgi:hypothetical protein